MTLLNRTCRHHFAFLYFAALPSGAKKTLQGCHHCLSKVRVGNEVVLEIDLERANMEHKVLIQEETQPRPCFWSPCFWMTGQLIPHMSVSQDQGFTLSSTWILPQASEKGHQSTSAGRNPAHCTTCLSWSLSPTSCALLHWSLKKEVGRNCQSHQLPQNVRIREELFYTETSVHNLSSYTCHLALSPLHTARNLLSSITLMVHLIIQLY